MPALGNHERCDLPFSQLYVHSSGDVFPCNFLQNQLKLGNIQEESLQAIWEGPRRKRFVTEHLRSRQALCASSQKKNDCHLLHRDLGAANAAGALPPFPIRLDIMLDSACNLKCVMCTNVLEPSGGLKGEFFWSRNEETFSRIQELEVVGGEPLISPHFFRLVELVSALNPDCGWRITTNASFPIKQTLLDALSKIRIQTFAVSLDSLEKETFETIRKNSNFERVMEGFQQFKELCTRDKRVKFSCNMVVQKLNAEELPRFFEEAQKQGFWLYPILCVEPVRFSVLDWPNERKVKLLEYYLSANREIRSPAFLHLIKKIFRSISEHERLPLLESIYDGYAAVSV